MARIYFSEIVQAMSGSIQNHVYSAWKGLAYIRNKAISIINPRSADQQDMRARTAAASQRWYSGLTDAQRALWNEYAQGLGSASKQTGPASDGGGGTKQLIPGNGGVMSGYNAYVMANGLAFSGGCLAMDVFEDDAPLGIDAPSAPTDLTCIYCKANGHSVIRLTWTDPVTYPPDSRLRIWATSLDGGVHKQLVANVALALETYDIEQVNIALGQLAYVEALPGHYHIQVDAISPEGLKSPPSNICQVEVTVAEPAACGV